MNEIKKETIDKYVKFLNVMKEHEGREFNIEKAVKLYGINNSAPYYARDMGLLDFNGKKIHKVNFTVAEPIIARRLIKYVSEKSREAYRKRLGIPELPVTADKEIAAAREGVSNDELPGVKIHAEVAKEILKITPQQKSLGGIVEQQQDQLIRVVNTAGKNKGFKVKLFGLPVFEVTTQS